ncbi:FtsX-like permease family protein [Dactylosporangium sp. NPDC048998]|uniref:FtsX-like permease family protein n=1 Tax=Dactylosporangium sp. NPDC048998 TaxID=3363976 RepID=UPI003722CF15
MTALSAGSATADAGPSAGTSAGPPRPHGRPGVLRRWLAEIGLGARLALSGGREGLLRTGLTALAVGLGVAVLLLAVSVPGILDGRHARTDARGDLRFGDPPPKSDATVLSLPIYSSYRDRAVNGRFLRAEGSHPVLPPGVSALPPDGSIVVSPALRDLLAAPEGALLRQRFPQPIAGTIAKEGLSGPNELYFYGTRGDLAYGQPSVMRLASYGSHSTNDPLAPVLLLLVVVIFVALLMPVAMFVAAATRFGGEQRDRRLAAVRLVGADTWMTRRVASGEAVVSAALGVLLGAGFFLVGRQFAERLELSGTSVFASDLRPSPALAALIVVAVPLAALAMTLLALRRVVVEPLGVVRRAVSRTRRRIWWRILLPLAGLGLLVPLIDDRPHRLNVWQAAGGVVLLLLGVATLLPWLFDRLVARLGAGGPVSWQIAVRRLQLSSDGALRAVNAIAVAAAGTIALQMLFAAAEAQSTTASRQDVNRAQAVTIVTISPPAAARGTADVDAVLRTTPGVTGLHSYRQDYATVEDAPDGGGFEIVVADCETLAKLADLPGCTDGDAFAVDPASFGQPGSGLDATGAAGRTVILGNRDGGRWTVPQHLRSAREHRDAYGIDHDGLLLTPGAAPPVGTHQHIYSYIGLDPANPDAEEHLRNAAMRLGPTTDVSILQSRTVNRTFASIRRGLFAGATVVLVLVGLSLLVGTLEQLRERRRTLAALVAFGTRRRTIALSILWQTAVPVALGLVVAAALGLTLGVALLRVIAVEVRLDWPGVAVVSAIAGGVVLLVTAASLPPLFRLMRPEGLRFE